MTPDTPLPAVTCAENIALLYLLHSVPAPPSHNPIDSLPIRQNGYTLSFIRERSLAGTLAFLSSLKDGPDHIPAVCVEQDPASASLNVLVAVNKARPGDGKGVLRTLKLGFEGIFALLSEVSDDGLPAVEDRIFTAIVSMCSERILCRLRFISNSRKTPRQPIKELLQEAIESVRQLESETVQGNELRLAFVARAREVIKLVDAWEKHRTPTRLGELVEGVHRLRRGGEPQALLSKISNRAMAPASRKNLLNIIGKVARYREAAIFLYRTAKKIPLVRKMKIVLVGLPHGAFQRLPANQHTPTLPSTLSRINKIHGKRWDISHICRLLKFTEVEASDRFAQQAIRTVREAKIHAEIQLLFYLEPSRLPSRVICSTKDACYLCNAFISMHGKIHTPRCHGRLYPGWRLPFSSTPEGLEQRFNRKLANNIRDSLATLILRRRRTVYPDPNESTLVTLPSESTLSSLALPETHSKGGRKSLHPEQPDRSETKEHFLFPSDPKAFSGSSESTPRSIPAARIGEVLIERPDGSASQAMRSTSGESSLDGTPANDFALRQGQVLSTRAKVNCASPLYAAGPLEVQIEYSMALSRITPNSDLSYSIEWLTAEEADNALEQHASSVYSAESLESEISLNRGDVRCFYITARGSALKIRLQPS